MSGQLADKVDDLVSSIDELEDVLKPLLETPLSNLTAQLPAPLDRAKLQVWLSYVLNDLVWIHLRTRGINPSNADSSEPHDVVAELDRVKGYFAKIKEAENPAKRALVVDGKVANRFIKHALASAISPANFESSSSAPKSTHTHFDEDGNSTQPSVPAETSAKPRPNDESSSDSDAEPEAGTWKAKKRAREADLAKQRGDRNEEPESDESLDGWEETSTTPASAVQTADPQPGSSSRTKRPRMDPFAGYSQPPSKPPKPIKTTRESPTASSTSTPQPASSLGQGADETTRLSPVSASVPTASSASGSKKTRRNTKGGARHKKPKKPSEHQS
ncbi:hypothetical protein FS749_000384 [Ceratobasidium sp. UAMH 11750]|nr:hypothetical protein FS749_000384 [Ceratobasidium sp. UAMH 11750]